VHLFCKNSFCGNKGALPPRTESQRLGSAVGRAASARKTCGRWPISVHRHQSEVSTASPLGCFHPARRGRKSNGGAHPAAAQQQHGFPCRAEVAALPRRRPTRIARPRTTNCTRGGVHSDLMSGGASSCRTGLCPVAMDASVGEWPSPGVRSKTGPTGSGAVRYHFGSHPRRGRT